MPSPVTGAPVCPFAYNTLIGFYIFIQSRIGSVKMPFLLVVIITSQVFVFVTVSLIIKNTVSDIESRERESIGKSFRSYHSYF